MGQSLDIYVGFGARLPWGEDEEFDFDSVEFYSPFSRDEDKPDLYDVGDEISKRFPLLELEFSYSGDYSIGFVLFIKSSRSGGYYDIVEFDPNRWAATADEIIQLNSAVELLGVSTHFAWYAVPSHG